VEDTPTQFVVVAHLPGVGPEELNVDIHGDVMAIEATRTADSGEAHHYHRELLLPAEVQDTPVEVSFAEGLLEVHLRPSRNRAASGVPEEHSNPQEFQSDMPNQRRRRRGTHG
jgi:HSP20 family molecular chaperone IbpA